MTTRDFDLFCEKRIRPDIRRMIEIHILEDLPLRTACEKAGLPYHKNVSQHKSSKAGKAYVSRLMGRRRVIEEFGVDEPSLVRLLEIRDESQRAGSYVASVRAQELCLKAAAKAIAEGRGTGGKKEADKMSRAELIEELRGLKLKAGGKGFEVDIDPQDVEYLESMGRNK